MINIQLNTNDGAMVGSFISDVIPTKGDKVEIRKTPSKFYKVKEIVYVVEGQNSHVELLGEELSTTSMWDYLASQSKG